MKESVAQWQAEGWVAAWQPEWGGDHVDELASEQWFVPVPRSSALCRHLLGEAVTFFGQPVIGILREGDGKNGFAVVRSDDSLVHAKRVVLATPAPQTAPLLADFLTTSGSHSDAAERVAAVPFVGTWAAMMTFDQPLNVPWQAWRQRQGVLLPQPVTLVSQQRDSGERVVVHANPDWSQQHIDMSNDDVAALLRPFVVDLLGLSREFWTHRWRYVHAAQPLGESHMLLADGNVAVIGDWCRVLVSVRLHRGRCTAGDWGIADD